jgi:hypothetical protein
LYPHTFDPELRGTSGPIQVTIAPHVHTVDAIFNKTLTNLGVRTIRDPSGGDVSYCIHVSLDCLLNLC